VDQRGSIDRLLKEYTGAGLWAVLTMLVVLAALGASIGIFFPKFEATALLQFPEDKASAVPLPTFKRIASAYSSRGQLQAFIESKRLAGSPAASRLLKKSEQPAFWDQALRPVLPFSRRDQREFGEFKDAAEATVLGVDLSADAASERVAVDMTDILAGLIANAVVRERVRSWVLAGLATSIGKEKLLKADIVKEELDVQLLERRLADMKAILTKYPEAARMDARQVVSVNPKEGGERFLSPLAQLVGFESEISERREKIRRAERELKQGQLLAAFFLDAERSVSEHATVDQLLPALKQLAGKRFSGSDERQEWVQESALRVDGTLDQFDVAFRQFGVREGVRTNEVAFRTPLRLSLLLAGAGLAVICCIALFRLSIKSARDSSDQN